MYPGPTKRSIEPDSRGFAGRTAPNLRAAYRNNNTPDNRNKNIGFRIARTPIGQRSRLLRQRDACMGWSRGAGGKTQ